MSHKKPMTVIASVLLMLALAGCGGKESGETEAPATEAPATEAPTATGGGSSLDMPTIAPAEADEPVEEVDHYWLEGLEFNITEVDAEGRVSAELVNVSSPYSVYALKEFWVLDTDMNILLFKDEEKFKDVVEVELAVGEKDTYSFTADELQEELADRGNYAVLTRVRVITGEYSAVDDSLYAPFSYGAKLEEIPEQLATNMANSYVEALEAGADFANPDFDSWEMWLKSNDVAFSLEPGSLITRDDSRSYEFKVNGVAGDAVYQATVAINLVEEAPYFVVPIFNSDLSTYYPLVAASSSQYAESLSNGDVDTLASVLNPDGLKKEAALAEAQNRLDYYSARFDLSKLEVTDIMYDDVEKNFLVTYLDAKDNAFAVTYTYGEGLASPMSPK